MNADHTKPRIHKLDNAPSTPRAAQASLLFLQVFTAADYYTTNKTLMNDVPLVPVDISEWASFSAICLKLTIQSLIPSSSISYQSLSYQPGHISLSSLWGLGSSPSSSGNNYIGSLRTKTDGEVVSEVQIEMV